MIESINPNLAVPGKVEDKTKRSPRISVIIPTRNEAATLAKLLERLRVSSVHEIIVVDGQSQDETFQIAVDFGAIVISSQPGRGVQLNAGASRATGDLLFFLHADTLPPDGFERYIVDILTSPGVCAGAFGLTIDAPGYAYRWIERMVRMRGVWRQMPYGDQGIFMRKDTLIQVGGFPNLPIMEDYQLMRSMRSIGRIQVADANVITSARRWQEHGVWKTTLKNQLCLTAYRCGVDIEKLARWRNGPTQPRCKE